MTLGEAEHIGMIGVGGSGMRGLALLLAKQGKTILGADTNQAAIAGEAGLSFVQWLEPRRRVEQLGSLDILIYSDAVPPDDLWRRGAREASVRELPYHEAVGEMARAFELVAVAGTHGKSTTTLLLAHILLENQLDPTVLLGAEVATWGGVNARAGGSALFVLEADEFRDHFLAYRPQGILITSIDFDHPDYFSSLAAVEQSFATFLQQRRPDGWVVVPEVVWATQPHLPWPASTLAAAPLTESLPPRLQAPHMRSNAAVAVAAAGQLGVPRDAALRSLTTAPALARRLEALGYYQGLQLISDYGHHPAEVAATAAAARGIFPGKKLLVIFEAHTSERLAMFGNAFAQALALADGVVVAPAYAPTGRGGASGESELIVKENLRRLELRLQQLETPVWRSSYEELPRHLARLAPQFDIALAFSAGVLDAALRRLVKNS